MTSPPIACNEKTVAQISRLALVCLLSLLVIAPSCTLITPGKGTWTLQPLGRFNLQFGDLTNGHSTTNGQPSNPPCPICGKN
jgi:hypothetical protein